MRFQRHAKIFRGQLDPAPVAGVFFLLVVFVLLSSLVYTPGVLVELKDGETATRSTITITKAGTIIYGGKTNQPDDLAQLRADLRDASQPPQLKVEPGAPSKLREKVRALLLIDPPVAEGLVGTDNPVVIVAVNLRGQYFYENQLVSEDDLRHLLKKKVNAPSGNSTNLTLVLLQDNGVTTRTFVRLSNIATEAGIKEVIVGTRPGPFSMRPASLAP
jgi:biopolymer transport protein ExbD